MGYQGVFGVNRVGLARGLGLIWKKEESVQILRSSQNFIDAVITINNEEPYRLTGFYGYPERCNRNRSWDTLRILAEDTTIPWVILGDFNDLMFSTEKRGRIPHPPHLLAGFTATVEACGLMDLGFYGHPFTWERGRGSAEYVEERLDRAFANRAWIDRFNQTKVWHLPVTTSDHLPVFLEVKRYERCRTKQHFLFENKWLLEHDCLRVVDEAWRAGVTLPIHTRLSRCAEILSQWGYRSLNNTRKNIQMVKQSITRLRGKRDISSLTQLSAAERELNRLLRVEEEHWKQRSKLFWLQSGDRNTPAFHRFANGRRRKNDIAGLRGINGEWYDCNTGLEDHILSYFWGLFSSSRNPIEKVLGCVRRKVTEDHNATLNQPFTNEEIKAAAFSMHPDKAPGDDGFNPRFYQHFWPIVGGDITRTVQSWLQLKTFPEDINSTTIVLIPKKSAPETIGDLRPIALCRVIYKIVAKVLANRLKLILPDIISEFQSAFVPRRLISDNLIVAFELMHCIKGKRRGGEQFGVFKTDMSKAYDRVEWEFLEGVMRALGICDTWVSMIMFCVRSVKFRVLINGQLSEQLVPHRGLRQGDPISPYLFIIASEGLSEMLRRQEELGKIHGCRTSRRGPRISHLLFADDALYFFRAAESEAATLQETLCIFNKASGQEINTQKSSLYFSPNVSQMQREGIGHIFGVPEINEPTTYMGLPNLIGRNKRETFAIVKSKIMKRVQAWKGRAISRAGKEILIKAVAQAIPTYAMSIFLLPREVCKDIELFLNSFWWKNGSANTGIHWQSWPRLCKRKGRGGLGFRSLHEFNLALLGKQGWRLLTHPDCLLTRMLKTRYFPNSDFFSSLLSGNPSLAWRSIWQGKEVLRNGVRICVGSGENTMIWGQPWLGGEGEGSVTTPMQQPLEHIRVSDLRCLGGLEWDKVLVRAIFNDEDAMKILQIPISLRSVPDVWMWKAERDGQYSVRSAYRLLVTETLDRQSHQRDIFWERLWKIKAPPKMINLVWRAATKSLPTRKNLVSRKVPIINVCPRCNVNEESELHCLVDCFYSSSVWRQSGLLCPLGSFTNFQDWLKEVFERNDPTIWPKFAVVCWGIWQTRNELIWNSVHSPEQSTIARSLGMLSAWTEANAKLDGGTRLPAATASWRKPERGWIKVNVDAAKFDQSGAVSGIFRDEHGRFCGGYSRTIDQNLSPDVLEAIAIREALSWLKTRNKQKVVIESDCQPVVTAINKPAVTTSFLGNLVNDCISILATLMSVRVAFVRRTANCAAHALARAARSLSGIHIWGFTPPICIAASLAADIAHD